METTLCDYFLELLQDARLRHEGELVNLTEYKELIAKIGKHFGILIERLPDEEDKNHLTELRSACMALGLLAEVFYYKKGLIDAKRLYDAIEKLCNRDTKIDLSFMKPREGRI